MWISFEPTCKGNQSSLHYGKVAKEPRTTPESKEKQPEKIRGAAGFCPIVGQLYCKTMLPLCCRFESYPCWQITIRSFLTRRVISVEYSGRDSSKHFLPKASKVISLEQPAHGLSSVLVLVYRSCTSSCPCIEKVSMSEAPQRWTEIEEARTAGWYTAKLGRAVKRRDFLCNSLFNTSCSRLQGWAYLSYGSYACTGVKGIIEWLWESKSDPSRSNLSHGICCGTLWKKVQLAEKPKTIEMSWQELTPSDFKTQSGLISKIEWRWNRSVQTKRKYSNLIHQGVWGATAGARATHHLVFLALHINMNIQNQTQFQTTTIYLNCPPTSSTLINYQSFIANHQSSIVNHQFSTINHLSSIISHLSSIINSQPSIIYHQSSSIFTGPTTVPTLPETNIAPENRPSL